MKKILIFLVLSIVLLYGCSAQQSNQVAVDQGSQETQVQDTSSDLDAELSNNLAELDSLEEELNIDELGDLDEELSGLSEELSEF